MKAILDMTVREAMQRATCAALVGIVFLLPWIVELLRTSP